MLIKITGESVKFIGSKHIQESHINMSLQLYISYLNIVILIVIFHFFYYDQSAPWIQS